MYSMCGIYCTHIFLSRPPNFTSPGLPVSQKSYVDLEVNQQVFLYEQTSLI